METSGYTYKEILDHFMKEMEKKIDKVYEIVTKIDNKLETTSDRISKLESDIQDLPTIRNSVKDLESFKIKQNSGVSIFKTYLLPILIGTAVVIVTSIINENRQSKIIDKSVQSALDNRVKDVFRE